MEKMEKKFLKVLNIMNYRNIKVLIKIANWENISGIDVHIISGDEIIEITYSDKETVVYDADAIVGSNQRIADFYDGSYCVYDESLDINFVSEWLKRNDTYEWLNKSDSYEELDEEGGR